MYFIAPCKIPKYTNIQILKHRKHLQSPPQCPVTRNDCSWWTKCWSESSMSKKFNIFCNKNKGLGEHLVLKPIHSILISAFCWIRTFKVSIIYLSYKNFIERKASTNNPVNIYLLKVYNRNSRVKCEIC